MLFSSLIKFIRGVISVWLMHSYFSKEPTKRMEYCTNLACSWMQDLTLLELFGHFIKIVERFFQKNNRVSQQNNSAEINDESTSLRDTGAQSKKKKENAIENNYKDK